MARCPLLAVLLAVATSLVVAGCTSDHEPSSREAEAPSISPTASVKAEEPSVPPPSSAVAEAPRDTTPLKKLDSPPQIAFNRSQDGGTSNIWVRTRSGKEVRVADTDEHLSGPVWSPNGKMLAFNCGPGDTYESDICLLDRRGHIRKLTGRPGAEGSPSFSPDGKRIAFAWVRRTSRDIYTIPVRGGRWTRVTHTQMGESSPVWSPDGQWIAHLTPDALSMIRSDGTDARVLVKGQIGQPDWSPDSEWLVYDKSVRGGPEIFKLHVFSLKETRLTDLNLVSRFPTWSPDGGTIAFTYGGTHHIVAMSVSGGHVRRITRSTKPEEFFPEWAPRNEQ